MSLRKIVFGVLACLALFLSGCGNPTHEEAKKLFDSGNYPKAKEVIEQVVQKGATTKDHLLAFDIYSKLDNNEKAMEHMLWATARLYESFTEGEWYWEDEYPNLLDQLQKATQIHLIDRIHNTHWGKKGYKVPGFHYTEQDHKTSLLMSIVYEKANREPCYHRLIQALDNILIGEYGRAYNCIQNYVVRNLDDMWAQKWQADMMRDTADWQINEEYQREDWRQKYYQKAVDGYTEVLKYMPNEPNVYYSMALAYSFNDNVDMAVRWLNKTIEVDPNYGAAHFDLGVLLNDPLRLDIALGHFTRAIEADPEFPEPYYHRAYINLIKKGKPDLAAKDLEVVVKLCPESADAWSLLGDANSKMCLNYLGLGLFYDGLDPTTFENWDKAEPCAKRAVVAFTNALKDDPENHNAYYRRADAYGMQAIWDKCFADLEKAIQYGKKEDPQYYLYTYTLGKFKQWSGNHNKAFDYFEKTFELYSYLCKYEAVQEGTIKNMTDPLELNGEQSEVFACIGGSWRYSQSHAEGDQRVHAARYQAFSSRVSRSGGGGFGRGGKSILK